ncbi:MAG: DegT/DnrJ/EryC1/StrS family aminotransferase [Lachnospiraceae bacterium]|nr:DegT/DnrJ/EryC1/StrS family aminotransferase [Lachnospiraceae bacterium]
MDKQILVTRSSMPPYEEYIEAIKPLWDTHWITNMGKYHQQLEDELKVYLKVPEISLIVNGHMALELAIQSFDLPEGSEVITTPFTFISTTHAIVRNRLSPVFCDVKLSDGTIDENGIESLITPRTAAIVPVHVYGNICNIEEIQRIADKYGLKVIYDAAHAFGVEYKGKGIGAYGDASIFSFHATKVFNTIEGGAITFTGRKMYEKLYNLKNFGIRGEELVAEVGANAKMNEFCAIMGLCNLKHTQEAVASRKKIHDLYMDLLKDIKGIEFFSDRNEGSRNYAYFPILVTEEFGASRDEVYDRLKENNIFSRKYFYPITSDQACFKNKYRSLDLKTARKLSGLVLTLPIYEGMSGEEPERITRVIKETGDLL